MSEKPIHDEYVVLVVDNVDPDNTAAAIATHRLFGKQLAAVIVTGRPVHTDPAADISDSEIAPTQRQLTRNTMRLSHVLTDSRLSDHELVCPVFTGLIAPSTLVPHGKHIDEDLLDVTGALQLRKSDLIQGDFDDCASYLADLPGKIAFIVGGPLTDIAALLRDKRLDSKFGTLVAQMGMFGFGDVKTFGGGRKQFNAACDPDATWYVINTYPGDMYFVPTDITKAPEVGYATPSVLASMNLDPNLVSMYRVAYPVMMEPRGEAIHLHDVWPVLLLAQLRGHEDTGMPFTCQEASFDAAPARFEPGTDGVINLRSVTHQYLVTAQDPRQVNQAIIRTLSDAWTRREHYIVTLTLDGKVDHYNGTPICVRCGLADDIGNRPYGTFDPRYHDKIGQCPVGGRSYDPRDAWASGWAFELDHTTNAWIPLQADKDVTWFTHTKWRLSVPDVSAS